MVGSMDFASWASGAALPAQADSAEAEAVSFDPVWAGEVSSDDLTLEQAELSWAWLLEHEKEIADAVEDLFQAYLNGDETMIEHGAAELAEAEQLDLDYMELAEEHRTKLGEALQLEAESLGSLDVSDEDSVLSKVRALLSVRVAGEEEESEDEEDELEEEEEAEEPLPEEEV